MAVGHGVDVPLLGLIMRANLNMLLKALENGADVKLKTGHTLSWSPEHKAFGFLSTVWKDGKETGDQMIFQIDSDVAWMFLIRHAQQMTQDEAASFAFTAVMAEKSAERRK